LLHSFSYLAGEGNSPNASLIEGTDGTLYGTTQTGGSAGSGTVFKVNKDGSGYSQLHSFAHSDGFNVSAPVIEGSDGSLYGTAQRGGSAGSGTIFKLSKYGVAFSVIYNFGAATGDASYPHAPVVEGTDGALYGTTAGGGTGGVGTVFRLSKDGNDFSVIYSFSSGTADGNFPQAGLVRGKGSSFYGTTSGGGSDGMGTVFTLKPDGSGYAALHSFSASGGDGNGPNGGLIQARDGGLYGTTSGGGAFASGTVFRLNVDGSGYSVLYSFTGVEGDGYSPLAGVIEASDGSLYGTTQSGGDMSDGTLFRMIPSNHAPVVTNPIPAQTATYGNAFTFVVPANTFTDPDPGQTLTYSASGLPAWLSFDPGTQAFSGTPPDLETNTITLTATDDGTPPLSTTFSVSHKNSTA